MIHPMEVVVADLSDVEFEMVSSLRSSLMRFWVPEANLGKATQNALLAGGSKLLVGACLGSDETTRRCAVEIENCTVRRGAMDRIG